MNDYFYPIEFIVGTATVNLFVYKEPIKGVMKVIGTLLDDLANEENQ